MKRLALLCLIATVGCVEDQDTYDVQSQWSVSWSSGQELVNGELVLYKDNLAKLKIYGNNSSLFVNDTVKVNYEWKLDDKELSLKRLDNQILLKYRVIERSYDQMELSFADDVKVNLHLKKDYTNI
ncbi:hypothetical protein [Fulvivirga sediminis]|uniref:Lipocalin-like domain-containing protein n=1 Tax=Fulvivirga sediminis TaxID=2803949 RepID=A0A937F5H1_9BACT|nr:hypothetical protein [Fulvivirga sediminis]MBL3654619.1 hypothetical protein [Fulvivirga sediminis]